MRRILCFVGLSLFFSLGAGAQGQSSRPEFRPAVLGSGPDSLVNRIDTEALLKQGQKEGAVLFCAAVSKTGEVEASWTYRGTPGTDALEQEVLKQLRTAKFTPAIYKHEPVDVLMFATVGFSEEKPHLRILLNQDPAELKAQRDFIGPQPVFGADSQFKGLHLPEVELPVLMTACVSLDLTVNEKGEMKKLEVMNEDPPLLGFADAALSDFRDAKFIPAFRDGDATESETTLPVCYQIPSED